LIGAAVLVKIVVFESAFVVEEGCVGGFGRTVLEIKLIEV
jgi:hypothetical protein